MIQLLTTLALLVNQMFCHWGLPIWIESDRGFCFTSNVMTQVCHLLRTPGKMHMAFTLKQLQLLSKYNPHLWYDNKSFINWMMIQESKCFAYLIAFIFLFVYASVWAIAILMSGSIDNIHLRKWVWFVSISQK